MNLFIKGLLIILRLLSDLATITISFILGYVLKFKLNLDIYPNADVDPYLSVLGYVILLYLLAYIPFGLYQSPKGLLARFNETIKIFFASTSAIFAILIFSYFYSPFPQSRYVIVYAYLIGMVLTFISRSLVYSIELWLKSRGYGAKRALIIGTNHEAQTLGERLRLYPTLGYQLIGFIDDKKPKKINYHLRNYFYLLGNEKSLSQIVKKQKIECIFVVKDNVAKEKIVEDYLPFCRKNNIELKIISQTFNVLSLAFQLTEFDGIPLMGFKEMRSTRPQRMIKRGFDLIVGGSIFLVAVPIMLILIPVIRSTSKGPAIYKQMRVTREGRHFEIYKFRSMHVDAEKKTGPVLATKNQKDRTTSIGNFLRKTSLDELPQLINVLKGDMSLIGPRPERPFFVEQFQKEIPGYDLRHMMKAGITGWAQINGRAELTASIEEKLKYDLYYIQNWSLLFDIKILLRTIIDVLTIRNTY